MVRLTTIVAMALAAMSGFASNRASANVILNSSPGYSCSAGTCTQSFDTGNNILDWTAAKSNLQTFDLNLFNPSLGSLTGVSFSTNFTSDITSGSLTNNAGTTETFTFTQNTALSMTTNGVDATLDTALGSLSINPSYSTTQTLLAGGVYNIPPNTTNTGSGNLTGPLSAFTGNGTVGIDASTNTFDGFSGGGGNISTSINTLGDAVLNVTYTYSPGTPSVPEPFSIALLGSGLLGLGFVRFRRAR